MSFRKTLPLILALVGSSTVIGQKAQAQGLSPANQAAAVIPFAANIRTGEKIGFEAVRRVHLSVGTNEFAFILPRGINLRADGSATDKFTITSADCSYFVTLRLIAGPAPETGEAESTALFKNIFLGQYEGASNIEDSSASADGFTGPAFDANWYVGNMNTRRAVRMCFIPTLAGILECTVVADPKKASEAKSVLGSVLMTFRSNRNGKLENIVLADKS